MLGSRLSIVLALAGLVVYTKVLGSTANNTVGQGTAEAVNTKIAIMEKVIDSLVQRSQEAENKLHTVETQLTDVNTQLKSLLEKDAIITTQLQHANEQIQKFQQDKTTLTQTITKMQVLESQTNSWKDSEVTLKAHQSILKARQDNQATILKYIETKQGAIISKQNAVESELTNQKVHLTNQKNAQIQFGNKQAEIVSQQNILAGVVTNHTQVITTQQQAIQNATQRLAKLEDSEKKITYTIQTHKILANQKHSDISLKQVHFELAINNFTSDLSRVILNNAALQAKQSLSDRKIQDLGLKQQVLDQLVVAQAGHIKKLDTKATINLQQVTWTNEDGTDNGILKILSFIKKNAESGLRVSFYGNIRVHDGGFGTRCNRWWFELNGSECTNPAKIEGIIHADNLSDNFIAPNVVSGICSGIPTGNVSVVFKVGNCSNGIPIGNALTGYASVSRIIVEEL